MRNPAQNFGPRLPKLCESLFFTPNNPSKRLRMEESKRKGKEKNQYKLTKQFERSMNGLPLDVQMGT